jgi:hypothetical protein
MPRSGRKGKNKDRRPAKIRYWNRRRLETAKVRHLVRHCGMEPKEALRYWHGVRQGRVPDNYLR